MFGINTDTPFYLNKQLSCIMMQRHRKAIEPMDDKSLEKLEFTEITKIIAGYTSFSVGREMVLNLKPISDYHRISTWLRQSQEAWYLLSVHNFSIGGASDVREVVRLATLGKIIEPASLIEIQRTLAVMRQVRTSLSAMSKEVPLLCHIAQGITELPDVETALSWTGLRPSWLLSGHNLERPVRRW